MWRPLRTLRASASVGQCLALVFFVFLVSGTALAQPTLGEVVDAVERDGYYAETGADVNTGDLAGVLRDVDEVVVVVLAADDPDGAAFAADQVRDQLGADTTVLVITPGEVASSESRQFGEAQIGAALDAALDAFDAGSPTAQAVDDFLASLGLVEPANDPLTEDPPVDAPPDSSDSGGGSAAGILIFLLIVVVVIGGLIWFARRKATRVDTAEVDRAKGEIRSQLEVVAHDIVEREHQIDLSDNEQAIDYYREASATYKRVAEEVEQTENLLDLAELNDEIDRARWQLEAAHAVVEGRPVPPEPEPEKPTACFFDPTHKPGTEECTIKTSAGDKEVRVCERCAGKLERGERPEPRMIDVGGQRIPAAKAPKSHGGLGMGGLSIFEVILGGLGALAGAKSRSGRQQAGQTRRSASSRGGVGLDWGEMLPNRRPSGDVFGPDNQPPRPRGLPRTPRSSPRSRTRTRNPSGGSGRSRTRRRTRSR